MTIMDLIKSVDGYGVMITDKRLLENALLGYGWRPYEDMDVVVTYQGGVIQDVHAESGIKVTIMDFDVDDEGKDSLKNDLGQSYYEFVYGGLREE